MDITEETTDEWSKPTTPKPEERDNNPLSKLMPDALLHEETT